ncbi:MAG: hypothetical protein HGA45_26580 [Chloroflexales bacterium]|nr:hypothetical protein [Chloroflexales bacterium]
MATVDVVPTSAIAPTIAATAVPAVLPTAAAVAAALPAAVIEAPVLLSTLEAVVAGPFTFRGTGTPDSTVALLVNGISVGTATVGADGNWSLEAALEAGPAEIAAQALDTTGAVAAEAALVTVEVGEALAAPTLTTPAAETTGGPVTLSGTGTAGSRVRVTVNDSVVGTTVVGADGTWELETILSSGDQQVVVEALGADGNVAAAAEPVAFTVTGGLGVSVSAPAEGDVLQPGPITVSGTGAAGTVLEVLDGDLVLDQVTAGADDTWTTQVTLEAGSASISVREQGSDQILSRPVRVQVGTSAALPAGCGAELKVGCPAWVTRSGGLTLRMRSVAVISADNVIARLPIGTEMELQEGPQSADGFTWWRVTTKGGNDGWVAGENLVSQPD